MKLEKLDSFVSLAILLARLRLVSWGFIVGRPPSFHCSPAALFRLPSCSFSHSFPPSTWWCPCMGGERERERERGGGGGGSVGRLNGAGPRRARGLANENYPPQLGFGQTQRGQVRTLACRIFFHVRSAFSLSLSLSLFLSFFLCLSDHLTLLFFPTFVCLPSAIVLSVSVISHLCW